MKALDIKATVNQSADSEMPIHTRSEIISRALYKALTMLYMAQVTNL